MPRRFGDLEVPNWMTFEFENIPFCSLPWSVSNPLACRICSPKVPPTAAKCLDYSLCWSLNKTYWLLVFRKAIDNVSQRTAMLAKSKRASLYRFLCFGLCYRPVRGLTSDTPCGHINHYIFLFSISGSAITCLYRTILPSGVMRRALIVDESWSLWADPLEATIISWILLPLLEHISTSMLVTRNLASFVLLYLPPCCPLA